MNDAKSIEIRNIHICAKKFFLSEKDKTNNLMLTTVKKQDTKHEELRFKDGYYTLQEIQDGITNFLRLQGIKSVWFKFYVSLSGKRLLITKKGNNEKFNAFIANQTQFRLLHLLGFKPDNQFLPDNAFSDESFSDKWVNHLTNHFFYVHCSIVDSNYNFQNGKKSDLLVALHNDLIYSDKMSISFSDLGKKKIIPNFNSIKFCIRDENNELIDFQHFTFVIEFTIHTF